MKRAEYVRMDDLTIKEVYMKDITPFDKGYTNETGYLITDGFTKRICKNRKEVEDFLKRMKEHPRMCLDCDNEESDCMRCPLNGYEYDCHDYPVNRTGDMWNTNVIARRREDGTVQFGMVNSCKEFRNVGQILDCWYDAPYKVDQLFSKSQLTDLGELNSETFEQIRETHKN